MEPALIPRIFDLFVQGDQSIARSDGGLGIGLTLLRSLVELHDGRVEAFSGGPGTGSMFEVRLPLAPARVAGPRAKGEAAPRPPARAGRGSGRRPAHDAVAARTADGREVFTAENGLAGAN